MTKRNELVSLQVNLLKPCSVLQISAMGCRKSSSLTATNNDIFGKWVTCSNVKKGLHGGVTVSEDDVWSLVATLQSAVRLKPRNVARMAKTPVIDHLNCIVEGSTCSLIELTTITVVTMSIYVGTTSWEHPSRNFLASHIADGAYQLRNTLD